MTRALAANGAKRVYILGRRKNVLEKAVADIVRIHTRDLLSSLHVQA